LAFAYIIVLVLNGMVYIYMLISTAIAIGAGVYPGGVAPINPVTLFSGEDGLLLDASDISTLWKDTAGTVPVTADSDVVARIDDLSGNGIHLSNLTAARRPLYRTSGGLHWLEFDSTDDGLEKNPGLPGGMAMPFSIMQGIRPIGPLPGSHYFFFNNAGRPVIRSSTSKWIPGWNSVDVDINQIAVTDDVETVLAVLYKSPTSELYKDDAFISSGNVTSVASSAGVTSVGGFSGILAVGMRMYTTFVIDRELTLEELAGVTLWMQGKTGQA
jgi:hypothetical protein